MWGASSWGVPRWAAWDNSVPSVTIYTPVTVSVVYEGGLAPTVTGYNAIRSQQVVREVLRNSTASIENRQVVREVLRSQDVGTDTKIVTRATVRETLRSQEVATDTRLVVRQLVREVLRSTALQASVALRRRQLIIPNVGPRA